jgi:hypothetical protein
MELVTISFLQTAFPLYDGHLRVILPPSMLPSSFTSFALALNVSHSLGIAKIVSPTHKIVTSGKESEPRLVTFETNRASQLQTSSGAMVIDIELEQPSEPTVVVEVDKETGTQSAMVSFHPTWQIDEDRRKFASEIIFLIDRYLSIAVAVVSFPLCSIAMKIRKYVGFKHRIRAANDATILAQPA